MEEEEENVELKSEKAQQINIDCNSIKEPMCEGLENKLLFLSHFLEIPNDWVERFIEQTGRGVFLRFMLVGIHATITGHCPWLCCQDYEKVASLKVFSKNGFSCLTM